MTDKLNNQSDCRELPEQIVTQDQLQRLLNYSRIGNIESTLRKQGVPLILGAHGKFFTTLNALDQYLTAQLRQPFKDDTHETAENPNATDDPPP